MATGVCVGGLTLADNRMVRLLPDQGYNHSVGVPYQVGQIWEMKLSPAREPRPPHVEDVRVLSCKLLETQTHLAEFLLQRIEPWRGSPQALFEGLLQATPAGSGYISHQTGVPAHSTGFWIPDKALQRTDYKAKVRFHYPSGDGVQHFTYVGFDEPPTHLAAGTLLRISLARWWQPEDAPEIEERCYLQLSGWYSE